MDGLSNTRDVRHRPKPLNNVMPMTSSPPQPSGSDPNSEHVSGRNGSPRVPRLDLDREGTIQEYTDSVQRVLEYSPDTPLSPCFFSHVHGRNLARVMGDLAHMVNQWKQRARWLLRLRTGIGRWQWYRASVHNHLMQSGTIQVHIRPA